MEEKEIHIARPFLKWAGGKSQLLQQLEASLPSALDSEEFTYIEPFVGGGAMLFMMLQRYPNISHVVINDINKNLTDAYETVKNQAQSLVKHLKQIEKEYLSINSEDERKDFYLEMRRQFNEGKTNKIERTTLLIFLNHTCFNGLYRENSKGFFNVPFGKYTNPKICNEELIYADSMILNSVDIQIMNSDFMDIVNLIDDSMLNFIYFDPPYRPLSSTSSFNSYVKEEFNDKRQCDLAALCNTLSKHDNVLWMLSNSDCSARNPSDLFFENIYQEFNIQRVNASRSINAIASKRGKLTELLIRNYGKEYSYKIPNSF